MPDRAFIGLCDIYDVFEAIINMTFILIINDF